jgi:DNA repair protein RadC
MAGAMHRCRFRCTSVIEMAEEFNTAKKDSKNYNKGQFLGNYKITDNPKLDIKKGTRIKQTKDAVKIARTIADQDQEYVVVISLKQSMDVTNARIVCIGGRNSGSFCPANAFKGCILDGASEMIIVHNHPSGDIRPSKMDKETLKRFIKAGKLLDINILDSVIVSGKRWKSMMEEKK